MGSSRLLIAGLFFSALAAIVGAAGSKVLYIEGTPVDKKVVVAAAGLLEDKFDHKIEMEAKGGGTSATVAEQMRKGTGGGISAYRPDELEWDSTNGVYWPHPGVCKTPGCGGHCTWGALTTFPELACYWCMANFLTVQSQGHMHRHQKRCIELAGGIFVEPFNNSYLQKQAAAALKGKTIYSPKGEKGMGKGKKEKGGGSSAAVIKGKGKEKTKDKGKEKSGTKLQSASSWLNSGMGLLSPGKGKAEASTGMVVDAAVNSSTATAVGNSVIGSAATSRGSSVARATKEKHGEQQLDVAALAEMMSTCTSMEQLASLKEKVAQQFKEKEAAEEEQQDERTVLAKNHEASLEVARAPRSHETLVGELQQCSAYEHELKAKFEQDKQELEDQYAVHRKNLEEEYKNKMDETKTWDADARNRLLEAQQLSDRAHKEVYALYAKILPTRLPPSGSEKEEAVGKHRTGMEVEEEGGSPAPSTPTSLPPESPEDGEWTEVGEATATAAAKKIEKQAARAPRGSHRSPSQASTGAPRVRKKLIKKKQGLRKNKRERLETRLEWKWKMVRHLSVESSRWCSWKQNNDSTSCRQFSRQVF